MYRNRQSPPDGSTFAAPGWEISGEIVANRIRSGDRAMGSRGANAVHVFLRRAWRRC